MSKKILIIGGSGFVGSAITEFISSSKYQITVFDKLLPQTKKKIKFIKSDILNKSQLEKAVKKNDIIILCAAVSNINIANKNFSKTILNNIYFPSLILEMCNNKKKFIYLSSIYVNGKSQDIYKISKEVSEKVIKKLCKLRNINYCIIRPSTFCGKFNRSDDVLSIFKKNIKNKKNIFINGNGLQLRNFIFSEDFGKYFHNFLNNKYNNKIINVISQYTLSIKKLAKIFLQLDSKNTEIKIIYKKKRDDDFDFRKVNKSSLENLIVIKSKKTINEKIQQFIR